MGDETVAVAVLEDETEIGERWRKRLAEASGFEAADRVFEKLSELDEWIERQEETGRSWLVVADLDVTTSDMPERYLAIQKRLRNENPVIADYAGFLLVERLREEGKLGQVLVLTGVNYGPVQQWFEEVDCRSLLKPVWSDQVLDAARELAGKLRGGAR